MWRAATWVARKRRAATRGYVECLGSAARHEWDWRFEYGTEIDVAKVTGHRVTPIASMRSVGHVARVIFRWR